LLAALTAEDYKRISADLTFGPLRARQILHRRDEPLREIYFPGRSLCSLLITTADGAVAEVAVVGSEGFVGVEAVLGLRVAMCDATVQIAGDAVAHTMSLDAFRDEMDRRGTFYAAVMTYTQAFVGFLTQSIGCNALHSAESRCCRWLLHAQDRLASTEFPLTHDLISTMLGVRRPTVSLIMADLSRLGVVSTSRGLTRINDRDALKARSCECYQQVKNLFDRVLPVEPAAESRPDSISA
jgi:CRP-like cAMP-binding protein